MFSKMYFFFFITVLFVIYFPMALIPYYSYGGKAQANIVLTIAPGVIRVVVEIMLLLHLISAFPIILNPPAQFFEYMLNIPSGELICLITI